MLALQGLLVSASAFLIDLATDAFEDHGKSAAMALRRAIGVGPVDDFAVVDDRVTGLQMHRDFIGLVLGAVIGNALRKTQDRGAIVRPDALAVRAGAVAQAAVFLVNWVEGQPNGGDVGRREVEVEIVLMRRRGVFGLRRLVEPLGLAYLRGFADEGLGQSPPARLVAVLGEEGVVVAHAL